jgi:hypothetical protein
LTASVIFGNTCLAWKVAIKVKVEILISEIKAKSVSSIRVDFEIASLDLSIRICQVLYRKFDQLRLELARESFLYCNISPLNFA